MSKALLEFLASVVPEQNISQQEPMSEHTTFRVGGPAEVFVTVDDREQLQKVIRYLNLTGWPYFLLGNGSNLLVGDKGYRGVVIRLGQEFANVKMEGDRLTCGAAVSLAKAAKTAMENGFSGLEFASGIPGSMGGGVRMNAGAYGGELGELVESVLVMAKDGSLMELDNDTMEFGYRKSVLRDRPYAVLEVTMKLQEGVRGEILAKMNELGMKRRQKQPLEYASAGSTFKRPEGYFAGKLIQDAGLRGFRVGGAQVSEKHCGFVINRDKAEPWEILALCRHVQKTVKETFGVSLELEVRLLGEFAETEKGTAK